jgi:hypothetical protein
MSQIDKFGEIVILIIGLAFIGWVGLAIIEVRNAKHKPASHKKKKKTDPLVYPGPKDFVYVQYPGHPPTLMSEEHAKAAGLIKGKEPEPPRRSAYGVKW